MHFSREWYSAAVPTSWYQVSKITVSIMSNILLPDIWHVSDDWCIFQQDSALAHRAYAAVELLEKETPEFISPLLWHPNSPDLNLVDYNVWSILQEKVQNKHHWSRRPQTSHQNRVGQLDYAVIAAAVRQWRRRLSVCVRAGGSHFEHCF